MSIEDEEPEVAAIEAAIGGALDDGDVLTGWLVVGVYLGEDGVQRVYCRSNPGATAHADLGMLEYAAVGIRQGIARAFDDEADGG